MISALLAALTPLMASSGFGALLGWLGGVANRMLDFKTRKLDIEMRKLDHAHELALRDKDMETMRLEAERDVHVATVEGAATVEQAAYAALAASHAADKASYGIKFVDGVRGLVRPVLTGVLAVSALSITYTLLDMLRTGGPVLSVEQRLGLAVLSVEWVLFQASVCIGWWFANRPGQAPKLK